MLSLPVLRLILIVAAGLVLSLASCRSSAVVPTFPATAGYCHQRLAPRGDTAIIVSAQERPDAWQRRVKAAERPQVPDPLDHAASEQGKPVSAVDKRHSKAIDGDTASIAPPPVEVKGHRPYASPKFFSAQKLVHYGLHFVFPVVLALVLFPAVWQAAYLIMLATMAMDLDHVLAKPVFDPLRCSIGYHPLHSFWAIPVYALMLLLPVTQIVAVGLLFHLFTDTVDCLWNFSHCRECYLNSRIYALRNWVRKLLGHQG